MNPLTVIPICHPMNASFKVRVRPRRSAELNSAVSRIFNPPGVNHSGAQDTRLKPNPIGAREEPALVSKQVDIGRKMEAEK